MTRRRWVRLAACVFSVAVLTACVDVDVRLAFMPDGSGRIALQFSVPNWVASKADLQRDIAQQELPAGFKIVIDDTSKPNTVKINIQGPFKNIKELHDTLAKLRETNALALKGYFQEHSGGLFHREYELRLTVRPADFCDPTNLSLFQIAVRMPGTIAESNASKQAENTVVWKTDDGSAAINLHLLSRSFSLLEPFAYGGERAQSLARWLQQKSLSERLVFGSKDTVLIVKPRGGEPETLWQGAVRSFSIGRNGLVALQPKTDDPFHGDVVLVSVSHPGKPVTVLQKAGYDPKISPDGKLLAYVRPTAEFSEEELARIASKYRRAETFRVNAYVAKRDPEAARASAEEAVRSFRAQETEAAANEAKASHILITVKPSASNAERAAAKAKAEALAKMARSGADFHALAKKYSEDTGSKDAGGELGWFGHGRMMPRFENAVFGHKPGEIVGPVETQFGFHIIRVEEYRFSPGAGGYLERASLQRECGGETVRQIFSRSDGQVCGPLPCRGGWIVVKLMSNVPPWGAATPGPKQTEIVVRDIQSGEERSTGDHPDASDWMHRLQGWGPFGEGLSFSSSGCFPNRLFRRSGLRNLLRLRDGYVYSGAEWSGAILADGSILASGEGHLWVHRPTEENRKGLVGQNRRLDKELLSESQSLLRWAVAPSRDAVAYTLEEFLDQSPRKTRFTLQGWNLDSGAFRDLDATVVASGPAGGFLNLAWTPNGKQIVYEKEGSPHSLWVAAPASTTTRRLTDGSFPILFVKQGSSIVYRCGEKICSTPISGGKSAVLGLPLEAMNGTVVQIPRLGKHAAGVIAYGLVVLGSLIILAIIGVLLLLLARPVRRVIRQSSRPAQGPTCPHCHAANSAGARFCRQCGARLGEPPGNPPVGHCGD